jgi:hypothetical protein
MATRREIEAAFQTATGGQQLGDWMFKQKSLGASLRTIAQMLSQRTGMPISHESIRTWMTEG